MPATTPMPTKNPGDVLTSTLWNTYLRDNIDKLLTRGHRVLTVAQFAALSSLEGTKGSVPPDEVYLEVDSTNGIQWHLAYESGETTYKWRFLGGPPMVASVATLETTTSTAYADLATVGPSIVVPRGGDYDINDGCLTTNNTATARNYAAPKKGGGATTDADSFYFNPAIANVEHQGMGLPTRAVALAASDTAKLQYRVSAGTGTFGNRRMTITPVRIV